MASLIGNFVIYNLVQRNFLCRLTLMENCIAATTMPSKRKRGSFTTLGTMTRISLAHVTSSGAIFSKPTTNAPRTAGTWMS